MPRLPRGRRGRDTDGARGDESVSIADEFPGIENLSVGGETDDAEGEYAAWRERIPDTQKVPPERVREALEEASVPASSWTVDALLPDTTYVEEKERAELGSADRLAETLAEFGLPPNATWEQVEQEYEWLSRVHDPERHADADHATRMHHATAQSALDAAYRFLRMAMRGE